MSLKQHKINTEENFIGGWYFADTSICDDLIQFFDDSPNKKAGVTADSMGKGNIDPNKKESLDLNLPRGELVNRYIGKLNEVGKQYIGQYEYCGQLSPWGVVEPIAIQHYKPGEGFKIWHFERDNSSDQIARRHLAFMTYLNDVNDGGGTSFHYQDMTVKAEKGLTLIWPSEWTHTHKGEVSNTEEKYIITGWFSTYTKEQFYRIQEKS